MKTIQIFLFTQVLGILSASVSSLWAEPLIVAVLKQDRVCGIGTWHKVEGGYKRGEDMISITQAFPFRGIAVADVDGDGREDFVWSYRDKTRDVAVTPIGNWEGTAPLKSRRHVETDWKFQVIGLAAANLDVQSPNKELIVAVADDKGDHFLRMMDCRQDPPKTLPYTGYLAKPSPVPVTAVAAGDVDQDGKVELIVATDDGDVSALAIYSIQPAAPFATALVNSLSPAYKISAMVVGDTDGDGANELVVGLGAPGKNVIRVYQVHSAQAPIQEWTLKQEIKLPANQEVKGLAVFTP